MIRFRLPTDGEECLAFAYSPLLEATLSLHVLVEPKHHPLQHAWVRRMRALPAELRREIRRLRFLYDRTVPEFLMQAPAGGYSSFEDELLRRRDGGDRIELEEAEPAHRLKDVARRAVEELRADGDAARLVARDRPDHPDTVMCSR